MCGLLALVRHPSAGVTAETVEAVAESSHLMRHRGPDEPGTWSDIGAAGAATSRDAAAGAATSGDAAAGAATSGGAVVFGFNRLSIIDIEHSHQPLRWGPADAPGRYMLVFNGEIYNYLELRAELAAEHGAVFATDGDGEAILAAYHYWGADALTTRSASSRCSWRPGPAEPR